MRISFLPFLTFILLSATPHPIYLSVANIEIENSHQWHATFRLFFDDLEDAIQNQEGQRPNLKAGYLDQNKDAIQLYLTQHFRLACNGELDYRIDRLERENNVVLVHIIGVDEWPSSPVQITNNILLELFEAQKNILKINSRGSQRLLYFKKGETLFSHPE